MIVCTYEDRQESLVGLKLLVLSLARHCPDVEVHAFVPEISASLGAWADRQPTLRLLPRRPDWPDGWNVKPTLLADRLDAGFAEVVWLDADLILTGDFRRDWPTDEVCVVAEEYAQQSGERSAARIRASGFTVGRVFPGVVNSSVVRVTAAHRSLVARWVDLLERPEYLEAQQKPTRERALHHVGDQDALEALLGSTAFADTPVQALRPPDDILHVHCGVYASYPIAHRLVHLTAGLPPLIHAIGQPKPWSAATATRRSVGLSPYCAVAAPYAADLDEPVAWLTPHTPWGRFSHALAFGNPSLRDLPTALAGALRRALVAS